MEYDVHNFSKKLERMVSKIRNSTNISLDNKRIILGFHQSCLAEGISPGRILKYVYALNTLSGWLGKDFCSATKDDLKSLVLRIQSATYRRIASAEEIPYSHHSRRDFKIAIKKLYKWIKGTDETPEEVRWIRTEERNKRTKLPDDMLSENDVKRLIDHAENPRNKAFISLLYESGCRIGELVLLRIKNLVFDKYGAQLVVHGKTGYRRIRVIASVPYLVEWLNEHPNKNDPESPVWIGRNFDQIGYATIKGMLTNVARKAEVRKRVNPHNFRHSRATQLANHLTEAQMKEFFGWVQGSDMAAVYVHLSGRDVDKALLKTYGLEIEEHTEISQFVPKICPRCQNSNAFTNRFCSNCSMTLDEKEATAIIQRDMARKDVDKVMDLIFQDPELRSIIEQKVRQTVIN